MSTRLYVSNLEESINEVELEDLFSKYGKVLNVVIYYDSVTWESKGYGYVDLRTEEEALKAVEALNGKILKGKPITVKFTPEKVIKI